MPGTDRRGFLKAALAAAAGAVAGPARIAWCAARGGAEAAPAAAAGRLPNIVFMLADDVGWSDLGCYGADLHETPNLDRLAGEGVRFTQAYAMSVCSPTRAAILTGKHAARLHMTIWREGALQPPGGNRPLLAPPCVANLPRGETTVAEVLKDAGYVTLHVGKWHLGDGDSSPETHGFDVNVGGTHWGAPNTFFHPFSGADRYPEFRYVPGLGLGKPGEYLTDRLTDEALRLVDEAGDRPFLLHLWFHNAHTPIEGKPDLVERYRAKLRPGLRHRSAEYAAMIHSLDENVGRVLRRLDERGLAGRTLVVFMSDNGGYINMYQKQQVTDNTPLRSGKASLYEGGIRVPLIIRRPGATPRGAVCDEPVVCMDLYRTFAEAAGVPASALGDAAPDGLSLVPLLADPAARLGREALFFHYPHYYATTSPVGAVRAGEWKLLEYFEDGHLEMYNLKDDLGETTDLSAKMPEKARQLHEMLVAWRKRVGALPPTRNPDAKPRPS